MAELKDKAHEPTRNKKLQQRQSGINIIGMIKIIIE